MCMVDGYDPTYHKRYGTTCQGRDNALIIFVSNFDACSLFLNGFYKYFVMYFVMHAC